MCGLVAELCGSYNIKDCSPRLSMGYSRQEYWSELPLPSPRDLPNPGIKPSLLHQQIIHLYPEPPGKPLHYNSPSIFILLSSELPRDFRLWRFLRFFGWILFLLALKVQCSLFPWISYQLVCSSSKNIQFCVCRYHFSHSFCAWGPEFWAGIVEILCKMFHFSSILFLKAL